MTEYETIQGTTPMSDHEHEPRTIKRSDANDLHMMTEIGDGVFVQWGECRKCTKRVAECGCKGGPIEPDFMTTWRNERFNFTGRPIPYVSDTRRKVLATVITELREQGYLIVEPGNKESLLRAAQEAQDATNDDSNDSEIDLLREALEEALGVLGLDLPASRDPDDEAEGERETATYRPTLDTYWPNPDEPMELEECLRSGNHLTECDEDGYCNYCGHQDNDDHQPESESESSDTRQNVDDGLDQAKTAVLAARDEKDGTDVGF